MAHREPDAANQKMFTLALLVVTVLALYFAADVLMPLALAILLTFILAPLVTRFERWRLGRVPAVLLAVGLAFGIVFSIGWVVGNQVVSLAGQANTYRDNIVSRIQAFKRTDSGPLSKLEQFVERFNAEITEPVKQQVSDAAKPPGQAADSANAAGPASEAESTPPPRAPQPVPVQIVQPQFSPYSVITGVLPGALGWLATAGIVVVFVIFMLLEREDMRNRLIRLSGAEQITTATQALDDAGYRVSKYLRMQLLINASYGVMIALGLYLIGLPNALTWGLFAGVMRYLPYVGPWLGAGVGILLSLAVSDSWTEPALAVTLFVVAELIVNNVMEPVLYHSSTGISTVGILVAALFWTWMWGPVGLVLATPLTVCLVVMGRYVPNLEFLTVLLSDDDVLPPSAHLYQRLLVSDEEESRELVESYLREHSPDELFEHVLLPALELTEQDAHRGTIDEARRGYILENLHDLLDEIPELSPGTSEPAERPATRRHVLIVPARDLADEIAGHLLATRLGQRGVDVTVLSHQLLLSEVVEKIASAPAPLVFVSAIPPLATRHARNLIKRLRTRLDGVKIIAGLWNYEQHAKRTERLTSAGCQLVIHRLEQAIEAVERHAPQRLASSDEAKQAADKPAAR